MATVKEKFKEVFGTDPSPELKNRLNLIKNKLQIDDNDSLWILFMGVGYLNEMYAKIPKLINSQIKNLKSISFKHLCSLCSLVILCILIFFYQTYHLSIMFYLFIFVLIISILLYLISK